MKTIAVTGATGFVGQRLVDYNRERFVQKILPLRNVAPGSLDLSGVDAVVHLAGKAHDMTKPEDSVYFNINYEITKQLADHAKKSGVQQFIYASSIKVYGDDVNGMLNETSECRPTDAYGASKLKAEQYLRSIETPSFKIAIVRPPLVYGPGVKGNMIRLLQLANRKFPLPFGQISNARSMVFVDNLVELINAVIETQATGIFIAGDAAPVSTSNLLRIIRQNMGNPAGLVSIPLFARNIMKRIKPALYMRLFGSLVFDNSVSNYRLGFTPPYSTAEGIKEMVNWYQTTQLN